MTLPEIKLSKHPRTGVKRMHAGMVKILAMDNAVDNGAPTVKLDFIATDVPSVDFTMTPLDAMQLLDKLDRPATDFWQGYRANQMLPSPNGREAVDCGPIDNIATNVDTSTGIPTFTVGFKAGAAMPAVEFSMDGPTVVSLMLALYQTAQEFRWLEGLQAIAA